MKAFLAALTFLVLTSVGALADCTGQFPPGYVCGNDVASQASPHAMPAPPPKAGSNLVFQVATTGSDSNPCTTLLPCLTIQRMVNVAAVFDYQNLYHPTFSVGAGTYTITAPINLPPLINVVQAFYPAAVITGDTTTPANVIVHNATGGAWSANGFNANWYVQGFQTDSPSFHYWANNYAYLVVGTSNFADTSAGGTTVPYVAFNFGTIYDNTSGTFTLLAPAINSFISAGIYSNIAVYATYTLPVSTTVNFAFITLTTYSSLNLQATFVNGGGVTGAQFAVGNFSSVGSGSGPPSGVPGTTFGTIDPSSNYVNNSTPFVDIFAQQISGAPTTSNLDLGAWGIFKDATQGPGLGITLQYNDAGTLYNVAAATTAAPGAPPTLTGTCTTASQVGGNTAGTFAATCAAQTVIMTFAFTAPNGWNCNAHDLTTGTDTLFQTSSSTASCTLLGTTGAADTISFNATAY